MEKSTMPKSNRKGKKIIIAVLSCLLSVVICAYVVVAFHFTGHFYPDTIINGVVFGGADKAAVAPSLISQAEDYQIQVNGRDLQNFEDSEICTISAEDINLKTSIEDADVESLLKSQKSWLWPVYMWGTHNYSLQSEIVYDEDRLEAFLTEQDEFQEINMTEPQDAYIEEYSEDLQSFVLVSEIIGSKLDTNKAMEIVGDAVTQAMDTISLEQEGCYLDPSIMADNDNLQQSLEQANKWVGTKITYDWNGSEVILSGEQIKDWVILKDGRAELDESAVAAFVKENATAYDTYKKNRIFHTILGYDLELPGGAFGWLTDQEAEVKALTDLIKSGAVGEREPEYASKAPWKGENDIGNSYLEADMTHQHLYLFEKGEIVLESDFVSGNMSNGNTTPQGVFGITYKTMNAVLRGADYVTPVTYWMPFHGNYGLHDATWRDTFGGDIYLTDGSHGCLNLPLDKAGEIYQYMEEGFPIICYYYPPDVLSEQEQPQEQESWE